MPGHHPSSRRAQPPVETLETGSVPLGGHSVAFTLIRSSRRLRTVQLSVGAEGITVRAPVQTPAAYIEALLRKREGWLQERLAAAPSPAALVDGAVLPFLGRDIRLVVREVPHRRPSITCRQRQLQVLVPLALSEADTARALRSSVDRWYRGRSFMLIRRALARWTPLVGASPVSWSVREQKRRWGSCSASGILRFNWRLSMLHPRLVDYVVVHELCHLKHPNHSPAFWNLVEHVMPGAVRLRAELRRTSLPV